MAALEGETSLLRLAVGPQTRLAYDQSIHNFQTFAFRRVQRHLDLRGPAEVDSIDQLALAFSDLSFAEGRDSYVGERLFAAIVDRSPHFEPGGSWRLPLFFRARQAWKRKAPGQTRSPLPLSATLAVAVWMAKQVGDAEALFVLTCFHTYFRPSEALSIQVKDVLAPPRAGESWGIRLHPPERGIPSKVGAVRRRSPSKRASVPVARHGSLPPDAVKASGPARVRLPVCAHRSAIQIGDCGAQDSERNAVPVAARGSVPRRSPRAADAQRVQKAGSLGMRREQGSDPL